MSFAFRSSRYLDFKNKSLPSGKGAAQEIADQNKQRFIHKKNILTKINEGWDKPNESLENLSKLGGVEGLARDLQTNIEQGICSREFLKRENKSKDDLEISEARKALQSNAILWKSMKSGKKGKNEEAMNGKKSEKGSQKEKKKRFLCFPSKKKNKRCDARPKTSLELEIERRREFYGRNEIKRKPPKSFFYFCWREFIDPVLLTLALCGTVLTIIGLSHKIEENEYIEGIAILVTTLIVVLIGAINNYRNELQFHKLDSQKDVKMTTVIREGQERVVSSLDVVVGDVILLNSGYSVVCDGILITGTDSLVCDESILTGETLAVCKNRSKPFFYGGTQVIDGEGAMLVTAVGSLTEWGTLMMELDQKREKTPLEKKLVGIIKKITILGVTDAVILMIFYITMWIIKNLKNNTFKNDFYTLSENFTTAVSIIVVAIPEGLPLAVVISLVYSVRQMYKENNFVRVISACETMGNATTICSDKTGTLTQNKMTVVDAYPAVFESSPDQPEIGYKEQKPSCEYESKLFEAISLNNKVFETTKEEWIDPKKPEYSGGNKTETSIFSWGVNLGMDYKKMRKKNPIEKVYAFSSATKRSSVLVRCPDETLRLHTKGAAERILTDCCTKMLLPSGETVDFTVESKAEVFEAIEKMVSSGLRCICLAFKEFDTTELKIKNDTENQEKTDKGPDFLEMTFIAITAIKDPVRPEVPMSVLRCQNSGVVVRMVTGDHPSTAKFIAKECGILPKDSVNDDNLVITGEEFRAMSDEERELRLMDIRVMARSTPKDKKELVRYYLKKNETVAVTGDGANDALALKEANVGLSMGIQGTDVAKEASDIIILDDSFASIVSSIMWGRSIYDNILKFLQFQLTINITSLLSNTIGAFLFYRNDEAVSTTPLPFTPVQLLWINIIMDAGAAMAYSTESPSLKLLERRPYRKDCMLILPTMWKAIISQALYQTLMLLILILPTNNPLGLRAFGISESDHIENNLILKTCIFNTFVWMQIFNALNSRKINDELNILEKIHKNLWYGLIFVVVVLAQILIVTFFGKVANVTPISLKQWGICISFGLISIPVGIVIRFIPVWRDYGLIELRKELPERSENSVPSGQKSVDSLA